MTFKLNVKGLYQTRYGAPVTVVADTLSGSAASALLVVVHGNDGDYAVRRGIDGTYYSSRDSQQDIIPVPPKPVVQDMYMSMDEDLEVSHSVYGPFWGIPGASTAHVRWTDGVLEIVSQEKF